MNDLLLKINKTKSRLLGFYPSFDLLIKSIGNDWEMLSFVKFLRGFWSNTRVRENILDSIGYRKFPDTIKELFFVGLEGFLSKTRVWESLMISANI